jgi:TonB family protein
MLTLMRRGIVWILLLLATLTLASLYSLAQESSGSERKVLSKVTPQFPALARSMQIRGNVKVEALVEPNGKVKSVEIKGGHPVLAQSAMNAVRMWRWEVASHETREVVEIHFGSE